MKKFCPRPFEFLSVHTDGSAWVCCHDWLSRPIGNTKNDDIAEIWSSDSAREIRESIVDGSFRYCDSNRCPALARGDLPTAEDWLRGQSSPDLALLCSSPPPPIEISLTYDPTCNLKCPSCRSDYIGLSRPERDRAEKLQAKLLDFALPTAQELQLTGYGDPFASSLFLDLLRSIDPERHPDLAVNILTNGLLLTPKLWESLGPVTRMISVIHVSIDACSRQTYQENRGGDFIRLKRNLEFVSSLRRDAEIQRFEISFVVQENNFQEMPAFTALGDELGCDEVLFQDLINWGTYTPEQFNRRRVTNPDHPRHQECVEMLRTPLFAQTLVNLSNLAPLQRL